MLSDELSLEREDRKKNTIHKSGSSNLLVDKTKSIVKLIIFVFSFALKVVLPNSKICGSEKLVLSNNLWSMLTKLLRSVRLNIRGIFGKTVFGSKITNFIQISKRVMHLTCGSYVI